MVRSAVIHLTIGLALFPGPAAAQQVLPGSEALTGDADLAADMVAGIGRHLDRQLAAAPEKRAKSWKPDTSSLNAYEKWLQPRRDRLRQIIGAVDKRVPISAIELITTTAASSVIGNGPGYVVHAVRWPILEGVAAEGLLLQPTAKPVADVIALPDADISPEQLAGLAEGLPADAQFARRLAENGCRVLVPVLIDRSDEFSGNAQFGSPISRTASSSTGRRIRWAGMSSVMKSKKFWRRWTSSPTKRAAKTRPSA